MLAAKGMGCVSEVVPKGGAKGATGELRAIRPEWLASELRQNFRVGAKPPICLVEFGVNRPGGKLAFHQVAILPTASW